jgi:hypothetical protein
MNYLSDDEENDNVVTEPTFDELYPEEEIDEEMMEIIRNHASLDVEQDYSFSTTKKEKPKTESKKDDSKQKKKVKTLEEYLKEEEAKKPKKWSSTRADNKKKTIESDIKRKFNPRLPPFRTLEKKKQTENKVDNSEEHFPSLIKIKLNK